MPEDRKLARQLAKQDLARMLEGARAVAGKDFHYG